MRPISGGLCSVCGERILSPHAFADPATPVLCGLCHRSAPPYVKAAAYGSYEAGLRELIHLLKYDGIRPAGNVLGRMLADAIVTLEPGFGSDPVLVVPVPLHRRKSRQRRFNQSELIARIALDARRNPNLQLATGVLERRRETESQIGLSRHQRRENIRGAFAVAKPEKVEGRVVLLVDDVFTTGTTVSECAKVLLRSGASKVWVATVARTLKSEVQQIQPRTDEMPVMAASA